MSPLSVVTVEGVNMLPSEPTSTLNITAWKVEIVRRVKVVAVKRSILWVMGK